MKEFGYSLADEVLTLVPVQISVVVCTYNRCDLLHRVLTSLCAQGLDVHQYEVIVVDNNSTDDSRSPKSCLHPRALVAAAVEA